VIFNIFGKKPPQPPMRDVRALTEPLGSDAIQVVKADASTLSHFGGDAHLPDGLSWPGRNGTPLDFLARLSLSELQRAAAVDWLPGSGALLFFYDMNNQAWGFDPGDRGAWAVVHVPDSSSPPRSGTSQGARKSPIPFRSIGFRRVTSRPSWERPSVKALNLTDEEMDQYGNVRDQEFGALPQHQVSGFPAPVQGDDMERECQLVSNGLYCGDSTGYNDPRASALGPGAADWRLLFQFDSDDELDIIWGDGGMIYFWVREQDARKGDFSGTWLVLQCS